MTEIVVVEGDITRQEVDVVVNAANERLAHGGGVALAIARAGGPVVDEESRAWVRDHGPVGPGQAAVTSAGRMPALDVVHVVGPVYAPGADNEALLRQTVRAALDTAQSLGASSIAVPAISSGIYGYPVDEATMVIAGTVLEWVATNPGVFTEVRLVAYGDEVAGGFRAAIGSGQTDV